MKLHSCLSACLLTLGIVLSGCSSGSSSSTSGGGDAAGKASAGGGASGGSSGGQSSSAGGGAGGSSTKIESCSEVSACGGDVVGDWEVKSQCLTFDGEADISYLGLTCVPNVASIKGSLKVTGKLSLGGDGKFTDSTVTTGSGSRKT